MDAVTRMRLASGTVISDDPLVAFLYLLARDEVPTGILDHIIDLRKEPRLIVNFTNGWLAEWAKDAATRLKRPDAPELEEVGVTEKVDAVTMVIDHVIDVYGDFINADDKERIAAAKKILLHLKEALKPYA